MRQDAGKIPRTTSTQASRQRERKRSRADNIAGTEISHARTRAHADTPHTYREEETILGGVGDCFFSEEIGIRLRIFLCPGRLLRGVCSYRGFSSSSSCSSAREVFSQGV